MPLVHRILITLRTLMEDEPQPPKNRRRRANNGDRINNRSRQTTALVLTFRDLFRSGGLNIILDEMELNRRPCRRNSRSSFSVNSMTSDSVPKTNQSRQMSDTRVMPRDPNIPIITSFKPNYEDETVPLLQETSVISCTTLVASPAPLPHKGLFSGLNVVTRRYKKPESLTVPLNPDDENKAVETLRKVLKWSPRKQNSATFAVSLPTEEKHTAIAVVENAVNRVKEEQLRKKKRKFLWLKLC